ncbi:MAG: hypothetical protein JW955_05885 [Sedimentisphaerales bacterium]|nr:hypothetical protein [Sedimentisphaerales bacterium]
MRSPRETERFIGDAAVRAGQARDATVLSKMQEAYAGSTPAVSTQRPDYWGLVFESRCARFAAAAVILLSLIVLVGQFGAFVAGGNVAWADVTQRFQTVPFFYASIYMKQDVQSWPLHCELWMSKGGNARVHVGSQVVFGRDGRVTRAFDIGQRQEVEADQAATQIIHMLATPGEFSLETLIQCISAGKLVDITPAMNAHAAIGEDLVVFEAQLVVDPGWVRIYALRESRLPVGLRMWEPAQGFLVDALITYPREESAIAFDANAFAAKLHDPTSSATTLIYLFLKDPAGRDLTPGDPVR